MTVPAHDGRLLLDPLQEQSIWEQSIQTIAGSGQHMATLLEGPRNRMANLAMQAHQLLCSYAPQFLREKARAAWQQDAENFSAWLAAFDATCRADNLLSPARLPLELIPLLEAAPSAAARPPLLLAGFDRILPVSAASSTPGENGSKPPSGAPAREVRYYPAADTQSELAACALWCKHQLAANPNASLLVITQNLSERRGEIERAFLNYAATENSAAPLFEFSLGIPLSQVALARGAHLLLRWLSSPSNDSPLAENELDWLLSTGQIAAESRESIALQPHMRALRRRGLERPQWPLNAFLDRKLATPAASSLDRAHHGSAAPPRRRERRQPQSPLDWAELVPQLLDAAGWPGARPLSSTEFQALRRWQQAVESCASLGFDGRRIRWPEFLSILARALDETLFAPESRDAPIQIAGPAESAGLTADAIWFLGASETAWPAAGSTHPLLPPRSPARSRHAARHLAARLGTRPRHHPRACSAPPRRSASATPAKAKALRRAPRASSRSLPLAPQPCPPSSIRPAASEPLTDPFEDASRIPFPPGKVEGGSSVLTAQSQCPFKAFATARLDAQSWQPAEPGLTAAQRGNLLHAVLHSVWAGRPSASAPSHDLQALTDRPRSSPPTSARAFSRNSATASATACRRRYLELEEQRLTRLVTEWLDYESTRVDFEVIETEVERTHPTRRPHLRSPP